MGSRFSALALGSSVLALAVLVATACSSRDDGNLFAGQAGMGGSAASGGAGNASAGGLGGAPDDMHSDGGAPPAGGEGGDSSGGVSTGGATTGGSGPAKGGTGGAATGGSGPAKGGTGGMNTGGTSAGGEGGGQCQPAGTVKALQILSADTTACPGALILAPYGTLKASAPFYCCGTSDALNPFSVDVLGIQSAADSTSGALLFVVPEDATLGKQAIDLTCNGSGVTPLPLNVLGDLPPVVSATDVTVDMNVLNAALHIQGKNLKDITDVTLVGDQSAPCDVSDSTDFSLQCYPAAALPSGTYSVFVGREPCGYAANVPRVKLVASAP